MRRTIALVAGIVLGAFAGLLLVAALGHTEPEGHPFGRPLSIALRPIDHSFGRRLLKNVLRRFKMRDQLAHDRIDAFRLDAFGQALFDFVCQRFGRQPLLPSFDHLL